jgi:hypothetical protein
MSTTDQQAHQAAPSDAQRAAYYDAHRDEVEAWPETPAPPDAKVPKQRGVVMSVRLTMDEADAIEQAAQARELTVSAYLRAIAREAVGVPPPPVNTSRIADRLLAIVEELRPTSKPAKRRKANVVARNAKSSSTLSVADAANASKPGSTDSINP